MSVDSPRVLLTRDQVAEAVGRMAAAITELGADLDNLVFVGIQRRGVELAERIADLLSTDGIELPRGALDITLYRDDLQTIGPKPVIGETRIPTDLDGKDVVIVDDVLYTGRTVRAALDELVDFGRPARIMLCVLVDRGGRELPIQADVIGYTVAAQPGDRVDVFLDEIDGRDAVEMDTG
ncbi:MAG: bifunctional pyr operon transcriptional regulator/uracil phosphoribosyltransferase PyrR [Gemmatimonadales bacterium]